MCLAAGGVGPDVSALGGGHDAADVEPGAASDEMDDGVNNRPAGSINDGAPVWNLLAAGPKRVAGS